MVNAQQPNAIAKQNVIASKHGDNVALKVVYNGVECATPEERTAAMREHYRRSVLKSCYRITQRDNEGNPLPNDLVINGFSAKPRIPAILKDENTGEATENLEQYYERTRLQAAGSYNTCLKGLERIEFLEKMD